MFSRLGVAMLLVGTSSIGQAQGSPSPDSLVAHWLKYGAVSNWQPHHLFTGCPRLEEWQKRGIEFLLTANLSAVRESDLARAWMVPLQSCESTRLEKWYFDRTNAAVQRGDPEGNLLTFWIALGHGDSPGIRQYLRSLMLDVTTPERYRSSAGAALFTRFGPEEQLREYLSAFETRRRSEDPWPEVEALPYGEVQPASRTTSNPGANRAGGAGYRASSGSVPSAGGATRAVVGRMAASECCRGSRRWPQLEQNTASGSGLGPQFEHAAGADPAERRLRTRAATIASIASGVMSADSARSASSASVVYFAFRNS